jgi:hypothetical protein
MERGTSILWTWPLHDIRSGWKEEKEFHYIGHPTDVWFFTWEQGQD